MRHILVGVGVSLLAGCFGNYGARHEQLQNALVTPKIERETKSLFLHLPTELPTETSLNQQLVAVKHLIALLGGDTQKMTYRLVALQDGNYAQEMALISTYLYEQGARKRDIAIHVGGGQVGAVMNEPLPPQKGGTILLSVDRYRVIKPGCFYTYESDVVGEDISLKRMREGCVVNYNRMIHAAYPQDIYRAQKLEPPLARQASQTIEDYDRGGQEQGGGN